MKETVVIIGGVAVGAGCATRLRRLNEETNIILLEKDEFISFANCGLPYYIGDVITERDNLIVTTKESMKERYNIDVRNFNEAIKINREEKEVIVLDKKKNEEYSIKYDKLVLAPGANPIVPGITGLESAENVFKVRNIPDVDAIKEYINKNNVSDVTVVGAGFIGIEMSENLVNLGVKVRVLDLAPQVMTLFDEEMASYIESEFVNQGVEFLFETSIKEFKDNGKTLLLTNDTEVKTDMTIMAIGVLPETKLAKEASLEIGETGAIKVNDYLQTSDPDIFAGGDAIEVKNFVSKAPAKVPLAWPANRQGRLIADFINGIKTPYNGTLGSAVVKVFDKIAATTGLNERAAYKAGYNVQAVHIHRDNHAGYYPGASLITIKLVFDKDTRRVLGAQAFGQEGTEKRIDVIATAIKFNALVDDLADLELCYAPPFSSAKDPVNIAGYVASNVLNKLYIPFYYQEIPSLIESNAQLIDVRTDEEYSYSKLKEFKHIPLDDFRNRLDEIDFNKDIYLMCYVGLRGYVVAQILKENGFTKRIYNLSGGYKLYEDCVRSKH